MTDPLELTSTDDVLSVLRARLAQPVDYADRHKRLGAHLGFDVSEITRALESVPVALDGAAHIEARKRIAQLIAQNTPLAMDFVDSEIPPMIADMLTVGRHDVMSEFVIPCVNGTIAAIVGASLHLQNDSLVSRLFSQTLGISKRRKMNKELAELRATIGSENRQLTPTDISDRIALCILGNDALRGTLGCSLEALFNDHARSAYYPKTGVPFVDRKITATCPIGGNTYSEDTVLRLRLDQFEASQSHEDRQRFFGAGVHLCLGRTLAQNIWARVQDCVAASNKTVTVTDFKLRKDDVFHIPETFIIEVRDD